MRCDARCPLCALTRKALWFDRAAALRALRVALESFAYEFAKPITSEPSQQETPDESQNKPRLQVTLSSQDDPKNMMALAHRLVFTQQAEPNSRTALVGFERRGHYVRGEWSALAFLVLDVPSLVRLRDFCTEVLERGTVRTALEATECKLCDRFWAPWIHGPQAGEPCPFCGEAVTVKRKESSP